MILCPEITPSTRIRIISDVHLGHKKSSIQNVEQLRPIIEGCDVLIVNGDLAETREGPYKHEGIAQRENFFQLCKNLGVILYYIGGNHDPEVQTRGIFLNNQSIFITHGDTLFKTGAPWGREYAIYAKKIKDIIKKYPQAGKTLEERLKMTQEVAFASTPVIASPEYKYKLLNFLSHCAWPPTRPLKIIGSWLLYRHLVEDFTTKYLSTTQIIITGHLHQSSAYKRSGKLYLNTGAYFSHATPMVINIVGQSIDVSFPKV